MKKSITAAAIVATLGGAMSVHAAGQIQGDLEIQLTIGDGCEVTNGTVSGTGNSFGRIDFGTQSSLMTSVIDAQSVASAGAGTIQLNCTKDVAYTVSLDNGRNATSGKRNMKLATGTDLVAYDLYQDAARSKVWNEQNKLTGKGTGVAIDLTVYGRVPKAVATPPAGLYSDSVLVTVAW